MFLPPPISHHSDKCMNAGRAHLNRAVNDDQVAIEILPQSQWSCPSSLVLEDQAVTEDDTNKSDDHVSQ